MFHQEPSCALRISAFSLQLALLLCTSALCTSVTNLSTGRRDTAALLTFLSAGTSICTSVQYTAWC